MSARSGFFLLETVIAIVLVGTIGYVIALGITQRTQVLLQLTTLTCTYTQAERTLGDIERQFRELRSLSPIDLDLDADRLSFVRGDGTRVQVELSGTRLVCNGEPLADNVASFRVRYLGTRSRVVRTAGAVESIEVTITWQASGAAPTTRGRFAPRCLRWLCGVSSA
ncbi:MAG: hypothetical protein U1E76_16250 [Planctomycetota bacterium]